MDSRNHCSSEILQDHYLKRLHNSVRISCILLDHQTHTSHCSLTSRSTLKKLQVKLSFIPISYWWDRNCTWCATISFSVTWARSLLRDWNWANGIQSKIVFNCLILTSIWWSLSVEQECSHWETDVWSESSLNHF